MRLGTASLAAGTAADGPFIVTDRLDLRKYSARPNLARVLCDYIFYVVRVLAADQPGWPPNLWGIIALCLKFHGSNAEWNCYVMDVCCTSFYSYLIRNIYLTNIYFLV